MDEFQNFATKDIEKLFSEGRKFGMRLTIAHQRRDQLPNFLQKATTSAYTTVCFRLTPEDGREMAHLFPATESSVQPEDVSEHPVHYLLTKTPDEPVVQTFVETYLRPLQGHKRGAGRVEIELRGSAPCPFEIWNGGRFDNPRIADPTPYLDSLLYQVTVSGNPWLDIPVNAVKGFGNSGKGFFKQARSLYDGDPDLTTAVRFPRALIVPTHDGDLRWTRKPESGMEPLYHFIFHLRQLMAYLAANPIGKRTTLNPTDIGRMLANLPRRAAFVRSGDTMGVIYTHDTAPSLPREELYERAKAILLQTRQTYCHPRAEVEKLFMAPKPAQPQAPMKPINRWEEIE
jgi:hypothetical protein